jgi:hypothetical protein
VARRLAALLAIVTVLVSAPPAAAAQAVVVAGGPCGDPALGTDCRPYFPDVARDPHGDGDDLLAVYRWAVDHASRPSQLRMMRSRDGGATWQAATPFIVAAGSGLDFRDPSLTTLRSGRLLLSYFVHDGTTTRTEVVRRDADDVAFSAPAPVLSSTLPHPATSAKIVELANGQLLMPVYGTPAGSADRQAALVASLDGGLSWDGRAPGRQKTIAAAPGTHYQEPAIAEVAPGHVRALMRAETAAGPVSAVQSDSYGNTYLTTWGRPWELGVPMDGPELLTVPGTDQVPYLWSQPGPHRRPTMIAVRRGAVPWPATPRWPVYVPSTTDSGYPGTVALGADRLVTLVYDETRAAVIALRYTVSDVD